MQTRTPHPATRMRGISPAKASAISRLPTLAMQWSAKHMKVGFLLARSFLMALFINRISSLLLFTSTEMNRYPWRQRGAQSETQRTVPWRQREAQSETQCNVPWRQREAQSETQKHIKSDQSRRPFAFRVLCIHFSNITEPVLGQWHNIRPIKKLYFYGQYTMNHTFQFTKI